MAFRFVHTADLHLDSPLKSLALRDPHLADLIGTASRTSFASIIDLCLDEGVDALLIAGDLYDGDQTSMKTARFLVEQIRRLDQAGIRTFIIRGNHDAESKITRELLFPDSVKVFSSKAESVEISRTSTDFPVVVHGLSFRERHAPESLVGKYKPAISGAVNIGMMHTSLAGVEGHDPYAPCSLRDLTETGFNYWALGHIHKRSVDLGASTIVMPGIPQGRDINEAGRKSVTLVTIADDRSIMLEERFTAVAEFGRTKVDLSGVDDERDTVRAITAALANARDLCQTDHLVSRLHISGETTLGWRLRRDQDWLRAQADDIGAQLGNCWIDKIELDLRTPRAASTDGNPLGEMQGLIENQILTSAPYLQSLQETVGELSSQLPPELRSVFGNDEVSMQTIIAELAKNGAEDVLARLAAIIEPGV